MSILNQPFQGQLGNELLKKIDSGIFSSLTIFSAFAKNSGVLRLKPSLEKFKNAGGHIKAFIGIDLDGTSYEALLNLFSLCDDLYVIHSENTATTYHSKIYLLENATEAWCAIGSNNLTGGGLWTNFESTSIQEYLFPSHQKELDNIYEIIDKYSDASYDCSTRINSIGDIDILLDSNYINKEASQRITTIERRKKEKEKRKGQRLFGSETISIPAIHVPKNGKPISTKNTDSTSDISHTVVIPVSPTPAFTYEQFWFEMRKATGGSKNILDLSKLGTIMNGGSVAGTPYEYIPNPRYMYGGVKFFEIDPSDTTKEKDITINYLGKDYFPSTIKYAPNNGSWRIQLKGTPNDGTYELSKFGARGDFVNKILVFQKITPDYYFLSLLEKSDLSTIKSVSHVWGKNGIRGTSNSKAYGML